MSDENHAPAPDGDDEFAGLAPPRRGKSPLLAAAVIVLSGLILWHLRADFGYALHSRQPVALGEARSVTPAALASHENGYVTLSGQAERRYALYLEPRGSATRQTLFRLLGAPYGLFVRAGDTTGRTELAERWTGRLRRIDSLPYADALRRYYAKETQVTRFFALESLRTRLLGGGGELQDRRGAALKVTPETSVVVDVAYPGQLSLWLSRDKYPSLTDARHELERMKLSPSAGREEKVEFAFVIPLPEARKTEILDFLTSEGIAFQPRRERYTVPFLTLQLTGDQLRVGEAATVAWSQVEEAGVPTPVQIGPDSFLLVEGEAPAAFLWAPFLAALLLIFAGFNLWYLARALRSRKP